MMNTKADKAQSCSLIMCRFGKWSIQEGMYSVTTETAIKIHPSRQSSYNTITMYTNQKLSNKTNPYSAEVKSSWLILFLFLVGLSHGSSHPGMISWHQRKSGLFVQILFYLFKSSSLSHSRKVQLWTFSRKVESWAFLFTLLLWLVSYLGRVK